MIVMKKKLSLLSFCILVFLMMVFGSMPAMADNYLQQGLDDTAKQATLTDDSVEAGGGKQISERIGYWLGRVMSFIGILFLVLILYGGLMWLISRGDKTKIANAKSIIIDATIGLLITMSAYAIVNGLFDVFKNNNLGETVGKANVENNKKMV